MFSIPQSTSFVYVFKAYLSSDHVSEATGKTIAITISKAGGAFGNPNVGATNATEISSGWYKVTLDTTDTATLGILAIRGAASGVDDVGDRLYVVSASTGGLTNLDAAVSSRMATYTQPSGFLAATFPTTVASPTNITAGTITTVTNLTNAPTAGDFTASMKTSLNAATPVATVSGDFSATMKTSLNAATPAVTVSDKTGFKLASDGLAAVTAWTVAITGNITGNLSGSVGSVTTVGDKTGYSLTQAFPTNFAALGIGVGGHVLNVDTLTTYTGNTPQTGDAFALIGTAGAGLTALGDARLAHLDADVSSRSTYAGADTSGTTTLLGRLTSTRAGLLDNLDAAVSTRSTFAGGAVASVTGAVGSVTGITASDVGAIKAKTDNLPAAPADESLIIAATNSLASSIAALPTTTTVNAVKAKTDQMVFTNANELNVNVHSMNDVRLAGTGIENTDEWRPA